MPPVMFTRKRISAKKVQGFPVLYLKRVKGFQKIATLYKISWRKCL